MTTGTVADSAGRCSSAGTVAATGSCAGVSSGFSTGAGLAATGATTGAAGGVGSARAVAVFVEATGFPGAADFSFDACADARLVRPASGAVFAAVGSAAFALGVAAGTAGPNMPVGGFCGWVGTGPGGCPGSKPSSALTSSTSFSASEPAADLSRSPFRIVS